MNRSLFAFTRHNHRGRNHILQRGRSSCGQQALATGQQGFALIEVMIGALIFLGGVIAIAAMHSQAIRLNHDGLQRSQAIWLAYDIAERVALNSGETDTYRTGFISAAADFNLFCSSIPQTCLGMTCTAGQMAEFDVFEVMCQSDSLDNMLNPVISLTCTTAVVCSAGDQIEISVSWDERGSLGGAGQGEVRHEFTQR